jgi:hypothetical protein
MQGWDLLRSSVDTIKVRTLSGTAMTLVSVVLAVALLFSELMLYVKVETHNSLVVDRPGMLGAPALLAIAMDIEFPSLKCGAVEVIVQDSRGEIFSNLRVELDKRPIGVGGAGCHVVGAVRVPRVAGQLQVAWSAGGAASRAGVAPSAFNASHRINSLHFGPREFRGGDANPLDGVSQSSHYDRAAALRAEAEGPVQRRNRGNAAHMGAEGRTMLWQYFVKIVPSQYIDLAGRTQRSSQFSVTENHIAVGGVAVGNFLEQPLLMRPEEQKPGIFVQYDISPMLLLYTETRPSVLHFVTSTCAIVGGVFAVSGIVDKLVHYSGKAIFGEKAD